jgi:uncharacterized membrane protein YuzA (DUF378 family)
MKFTILDWTSIIILIIAGINSSILGLFNVDILGFLFGFFAPLLKLIYAIVLLAALYLVYTIIKKPLAE